MTKGINRYIIIVAAGSGSRFGGTLPKQFCLLGGRPVLFYTIEQFRKALPEGHIVVVISGDMAGYWHDLCRDYDFESPTVVTGGATRWESVRNALSILPGDDDTAIVLVHDGARPLVDSGVISRVTEAIEPEVSVIPVVAVTDSLRSVDPSGNSEPVDRSCYRAVQTPQGFMLNQLKDAYRNPFSPLFTDDASVMAAASRHATVIVEGNPRNIKITNPGDIALAAFYLEHEG